MIQSIFLVAFVFVLIPAVFSGAKIVYSEETRKSGTPPLKLLLIIDPEFGNNQEFTGKTKYRAKDASDFFKDIFFEASHTFHSETGKGLTLSSTEHAIYNPSPRAGELFLNTERIIKWLETESEKHQGSIIVFVTDRFLFSPLNYNTWSGYGDSGFLFFRYYGYDIPYTIESFLHELGHACGAKHTLDENSIMNPDVFGIRTYGDQRTVIQQRCG